MLLNQTTYVEFNETSQLLECYDMTTGKLLSVQRRGGTGSADLKETVLSTGEVVLVEQGVDVARLNMSLTKPRTYSVTTMALLCQKVAEGKSITRICSEDPTMPSYATLSRWRRLYPEIDQMLDRAREDRAEFLRDRALEEAMAATDKNDTPAQGLKFEANKWAASVDAPKRYGQKNKVDVAVAATMLVVDTGINRERPVEEISHGEDKVITTPLTTSDSDDSGDSGPTGKY